MEITFDPAKDRINQRKHAISLRRAADFDMTTALIEADDRNEYGEDRWQAIGFLDTRLHSMCFTMQGSKIRVINLRKATPQEENTYAQVF